MRAKVFARLLSIAVLITPVSPLLVQTPAAAQPSFNISFGYFYNSLAPYGEWFYHPRWGDVWHPVDVPADFRPYARGRWQYTNEYGWIWLSDFSWGDITSHYGRWVYDPYDGWLWVPGYVWAPAWVVWREGNGYIGWFPMPPDPTFLAGDEIYRTRWDWDNAFGYTNWYGPQILPTLASAWVFVDLDHFVDRDVYRYALPRRDYRRFIDNSRNITNYVTVNNRIVNRSININRIERATGRRIAPVPARDVLGRRAPITPVDVGRQLQTREHRVHGGNPNASARARVQPLPRTALREQRTQARDERLNRQGENRAAERRAFEAPQSRQGTEAQRRQTESRRQGAEVQQRQQAREEQAQQARRQRAEVQRRQVEQARQQQAQRARRQQAEAQRRQVQQAREQQAQQARRQQAEAQRRQVQQARQQQAQQARRQQAEAQRRQAQQARRQQAVQVQRQEQQAQRQAAQSRQQRMADAEAARNARREERERRR